MGSRFKFDLDFDDPRNAGDAPPAPTFSLDEMNAARDVARAEGLAAGRAEVQASLERRLADTQGRIAEALHQAIGERTSALNRIEGRAVELCTALLRKLFPEMQRRHGLGEIEALVRDSLHRMVDEPRVVVRLNDGLLDRLQERVDAAAKTAGFAGRVVLIGDDLIAAGDCRIEWADGGAERRGDHLWAEIDAAVKRVAETMAAKDAAPGDMPVGDMPVGDMPVGGMPAGEVAVGGAATLAAAAPADGLMH